MGGNWQPRTSLFARISLTFGLLVAIPLAVSGVLLTLVGQGHISESGGTMEEIGTEAIRKTSDALVKAVDKNLKEATDSVSRSAEAALQQASRNHIETSDRAVGQATDQIIRQGRNVFTEAAQQSAQVGERSVKHAADDLRKLHRESLQQLTNEFVAVTRKELQQASASVRPQVKKSVAASTAAVNQEKVEALVVAARRGLAEIQSDLSVQARTEAVQQFDEQGAEGVLRNLMKVNPGSLRPVQVVLVSPVGSETARNPESAEAQPAPAQARSWKESEEWKLAQQDHDAVVLPLRKGPGGQMVLRLVQAVRPAGEEEGMGALIADVPLGNLAEMASNQENEGASMRLVTGDGRILSSLNRQEIGATLTGLKGRLQRRSENALKPFPLEFKDDQNRTNLGVGRQWLEQPSGDDTIYGVVSLPEEEVLKPVQELDDNFKQAWQRGLSKVGQNTDRAIDARLKTIRPEQDRIAAVAAGEINRNIRRLGNGIPNALRRRRDAIIRGSRTEIQRQTQAAAEQTARDIRKTRDETAQRARADLSRAADEETKAQVRQMSQLTQGEATNSVRNMSRLSGWLILMFLAAALALATMTTRSIVRPINRLVTATQAFAAGDYSRRIRVEGEEELVRLATSFNEMAAAVEGGQAALHRSHDTLAAQKQRIQTIVDSSPDGLVLLDQEGRIAFMNPAACGFLAPGGMELPPAPFPIHMLPAAVAGRLRECAANVQVDGPAAEMEIEKPQRRVLQYRGVAIAGEDGQHQDLLLHLHDITRERQIDEMKSDFISLVSHELRTPLTSILGFSSYMLTGKLGEVNEGQKRALESVHRQAKRLSAIISDFLDVSRIESGRVELRKEMVAVDGVARRVITDLHPQAAEKAIQVSARVLDPEGGATALADEARVAQVFTNLLGNAYKFTEPDGRVEVLLSRRDGEILCQVKDTGCGIPADELDRVFDRFYQVEKVVTRKSGGTGLGLAIVKNIVEAHGGRIWIDSTYGEGTTVSFTLPTA